MDFKYVSQSLFHSSNTTVYEVPENLYTLLSSIFDKTNQFGSDILMYMKSKMILMTFRERVSFISSFIKTKINGTSLDEDQLRNMCDAVVIEAYNGHDIVWDDIISKCQYLNIPTDDIIELVKFSSLNVPIGADNETIISLSSKLLGVESNQSNVEFLTSVKTGAEIEKEISDSRALLLDLMNQIGANTNWSLDYILYLIYLKSQEALNKMNAASQLSLNNSNSYKYSMVGVSDMSNTLVFEDIAVINKTTNHLLDEIYSSSDSKVPNRLELSALLSDILQSSNTVSFSMNNAKNSSELSETMDIAENSSIMLSRTSGQIDSANYLTDTHILMVEGFLASYPNDSFLKSMNTNTSGLAKASNKVPNSELNLGAIGASLVAIKALIDSKYKNFISKFLGEGKDAVSGMNSLINSLTSKLEHTIGPVATKVIALIAKIALAVVAVNVILCAFKAAMCAIGSVINTISNAIDVAASYLSKFESFAANTELNFQALGSLSDIFSMDTANAIGNAIKDGLMSLEDEFVNALSTVLNPNLLHDLPDLLSDNCEICSLIDKATSKVYNSVKSHVDELVTSAYDSVVSSYTEGMKCPALSLPNLDGFSLPKLPNDFGINFPSLNTKVGC